MIIFNLTCNTYPLKAPQSATNENIAVYLKAYTISFYVHYYIRESSFFTSPDLITKALKMSLIKSLNFDHKSRKFTKLNSKAECHSMMEILRPLNSVQC